MNDKMGQAKNVKSNKSNKNSQKTKKNKKKTQKTNRKVNVKNEKLPKVPDSLSSSEEIFEIDTEKSKIKDIKYADDNFKEMISIFSQLNNSSDEDIPLFETKKEEKIRTKKVEQWNNTISKLEEPKTKVPKPKKTKQISQSDDEQFEVEELETRKRIYEFFGQRKLNRNVGVRVGYQPNDFNTVLNETCIKPLISFH